jgi:hypothetical protein
VDEGKQKVMEEELTCSMCLEQVVDGKIVRTLPYVHQVCFFYGCSFLGMVMDPLRHHDDGLLV